MCVIICSIFVISFIPLILSVARVSSWLYFHVGAVLFFVVVFHRLILCVPVTMF